MKPRRMEIEFDLDCMTAKDWHAMESDLESVLMKYGWHLWGSGCTVGELAEDEGGRTRDIGLMHCPDTQCDSWGKGIGCMAEKCDKEGS